MSNKPNNLQLAVAKVIEKEPPSGDFDEKNRPPVENISGVAGHASTKAGSATTKPPAIQKLSLVASKTPSGTTYPSDFVPNPRHRRAKATGGGRFIYKRNSASDRRLVEKSPDKWTIRQNDIAADSLKTKLSAHNSVAKERHMQKSVAASFMDCISAIEAKNGQPMPTNPMYTTIINAYPNLDKKDEQALAHERKKNPDAANVLFKCNMKFAYGLVKSKCGFGQSLEGTLQAANIGLWEAVMRFEPGHKAAFTTYAHDWIKKSLRDHFAENQSAVSFKGEAARKMMFKLRAIKKRKDYDELTKAEASDVAEELGVETRDVMAMEMAFRRCDQTIDDDCKFNEYTDESTGEARLIAGLDAKAKVERVRAALATMSGREHDIFMSRRMKKEKDSLQILANRWKISVERVRQIEKRAVAKLKKA